MAAFEMLKGRFVVLDGPDGAGKGTQLDRLERALRADETPVVRARDPGGTAIGDRIRHILLDYRNRELDVRCEALLFMASRAQLIAEVVVPAIAASRAVLCDRFVSATCAYQGAAGADINAVLDLARFAVGDHWPDLTIILDVPAEVGLARAGQRQGTQPGRSDIPEQAAPTKRAGADMMESRPVAYHRRVRQLFLELPQLYPAPVVVVDGLGTPDEVHERIKEALRALPG